MALKPRRRTAVVAAILAAFVALTCVRLGFWQLDRLEQRRTLNASVTRASTHPPVPLTGALIDSVSADPSGFHYRTVLAHGTPDGDPLLVRGRSLDGRPGVHLIIPFRLLEGDLVLVNQGWLPSADGATVDPRPYLLSDTLTLLTTIQQLTDAESEVRRSEVPIPDFPVTSYLRLSREAVAEELRETPLPVILQLSERPPAAAELPIPLPPPALDEGSHLGYAIQWFSFAIIALVGAVTLAFRARRQA